LGVKKRGSGLFSPVILLTPSPGDCWEGRLGLVSVVHHVVRTLWWAVPLPKP
jgi:hypothetical protein